MSPFQEDLSAFFGPAAVYGNDEIKYGTETWYGIFDQGYAESAGDQAGIAPAITCATADIPDDVAAGTQIRVNGVYYKIKVVQPDEDGAVTVLQLRDNTA